MKRLVNILLFVSTLTSISAELATAQGRVRNGGTIWNFRGGGGITANQFFNSNAAGNRNGVLRNADTIRVVNGASGFFQNFGSAGGVGTVKNYIATGTAAGGGGAILPTGQYANGGGTTDNDSAHADPAGTLMGTIVVAGGLNIGTGGFDTDSGKVEFAIAMTLPTINYGTLVLTGSSAKSLAGSITVNDSIRNASGSTLNIGSNTLSLKGSSNVSTGSFLVTNGTVQYNGDRDQTIIPASYRNLVLSSSAGNHTKTVNGTMAFVSGGSLNIGTRDTLEVASGVLNLTNLTSGGYTNSSAVKVKSSSTPVYGTIANVGSYIFESDNTQTIAAATYGSLTLRGSGAKNFPNATVAVRGEYRIEGSVGARDYRSAGSSATFAFDGSSPQSISGLSAEQFNQLRFSNTGTKTLGSGSVEANNVVVIANSGAVTSNASVTANNGVTINSGASWSNNADMNILAGGLTINSTASFGNTSNVIVTGNLTNNGALSNTGIITIKD